MIEGLKGLRSLKGLKGWNWFPVASYQLPGDAVYFTCGLRLLLWFESFEKLTELRHQVSKK